MTPHYTRAGVVTAACVTGLLGVGVGAWLASAGGSEAAAWAQAVGTIIAIFVAAYVPTKIHQNEQKSAREQRNSYGRLLLDAFRSFRTPLRALEALIEDKEVSELGGAAWLPPQAAADQMRVALHTLDNLAIVLSEIRDLKRLENFAVVLPLLDFHRKLDETQPVFERETRWLAEHGDSVNVVSSAVSTLGHHARELLPEIERIIEILEGGFVAA